MTIARPGGRRFGRAGTPLIRPGAIGVGGAVILAVSAFGTGALPVTGGGPLGWAAGHGRPPLGLEVGPRTGLQVAYQVGAGFGLALLVGAWIAVGRLVRDHAITPWALARTAAAWAAPLVIAPPLFSRDVYSYVVQGAMQRDGLDPYRFAAASYGSPLATNVDTFWQHSTAPYGSLFLALAAAVMRLAGSDVVLGVLFFRLVMALALVATGTLLVGIARRYGIDGGTALWLGILNPLVLLHTVSGAHNDILVVALLLGAMAVAARGRPFRAAVLVGAAVLVKVSAVVALVFLVPAAVQQLRLRGGWRSAFAAAVLLGLVAVATVGLVTAVTGGWYGWVGALVDTTRVHNGLSVSTDLGDLLTWATRDGPFERLAGGATTVTRGLALLGAGALVLVVLGRTADRPVVGLGLAMVVVVVLGPVVHPWYLLWGFVPLAASTDSRRLRQLVVAGSVALVCYAVPAGNGLTLPGLAVDAVGLLLGAACCRRALPLPLVGLPRPGPAPGGTGTDAAGRAAGSRRRSRAPARTAPRP